jgi:hypothetical protein
MADLCCDTERVCSPCEPPTVFTVEEEVALEQMRKIRNEAAPVMDRMTEIRKKFKQLTLTSEAMTEIKELQTRLEILREHWAGWQRELDEAMEKKLIKLGHKEPDVQRFG